MWESVVVATPILGMVAATTSDNTGFDLTSLIGAGITPAIVIVLMLLGKLRTEPEVKRLESEVTQLRAQVREKDQQMLSLQGGLVDRAIPALTRSTLVLEALSPMLRGDDPRSRLMPGSTVTPSDLPPFGLPPGMTGGI